MTTYEIRQAAEKFIQIAEVIKGMAEGIDCSDDPAAMLEMNINNNFLRDIQYMCNSAQWLLCKAMIDTLKDSEHNKAG